MGEVKSGAKYQCLRCFHKWTGLAGPVRCVKCGHLWVKWLNYEEMFGKGKK